MILKLLFYKHTVVMKCIKCKLHIAIGHEVCKGGTKDCVGRTWSYRSSPSSARGAAAEMLTGGVERCNGGGDAIFGCNDHRIDV